MKTITLLAVLVMAGANFVTAENNHNTLPGTLSNWYEKPEARIRILPPPENEDQKNENGQGTQKTNSTKPQEQEATKHHMSLFDAGASV